MSLLSRIFKGTIKKSIAQMASDTDVIQVAIAHKLVPTFISQYGNDRGFTIMAAVSNKLFASGVSPKHSKEDLELAESHAADILKTDSEILYAALMSCRARLIFEAEKNTEKQWFIWDNIQWMASICNLPPDEANPATIRTLASTLHKKYLLKK
jgi:hypothetical protein